jgi:O-acetyl-ADP-ribose deacetylase (regulator of RNase III)
MEPNYQEVEGDLIKLALEGKFDVIGHGVNCFCTMGAGIAPQMAKAFGCDTYPLEAAKFVADINKLGQIDIKEVGANPKDLWAINCYTQYGLGSNHKEGTSHPLSYPALILCLQKINHAFPGKHIGLPLIGCGLAGGNWEDVKGLIQKNLNKMKVTIVHYKPEENGSTSSK